MRRRSSSGHLLLISKGARLVCRRNSNPTAISWHFIIATCSRDDEVMRYSTWVTTFQPIKNRITANTAIEGFVFLKDGADMDFVRKQAKRHVWTFIVSDEGRKPIWLISD